MTIYNNSNKVPYSRINLVLKDKSVGFEVI